MTDDSELTSTLTYPTKKTLFPIQRSELNSDGASHGLLFPCVSGKEVAEDGVKGGSNACTLEKLLFRVSERKTGCRKFSKMDLYKEHTPYVRVSCVPINEG